MSTIGNDTFDVKKLLSWIAIGVVAIVALKVLFALVGFLTGAILFALFTLGPILFLGWLVVKALRYFTRDVSGDTM